MNRPTDKDLQKMVRWPIGTVGFENELAAYRMLRQLCDDLGYGAVPQMAQQIEAIWRDPEHLKVILAENKKHFEQMVDCGQQLYAKDLADGRFDP
jgi:hypothetical protein